MLSVRSAVTAAFVVLILAIGGSVLTMLQEPDSNGFGRDSYGRQAYGHRALYETLESVGYETSRSFSPPSEASLSEPNRTTLVFIAPFAQITATEPVYIERLQSWVNDGGRVVFAAPPSDGLPGALLMMDLKTPRTFLECLGLENVRLKGGSTPSPNGAVVDRFQGAESLAEGVISAFETPKPSLMEVGVECTGSFEQLQSQIKQLNLFQTDQAFLESNVDPDGTIQTTGDEAQILAASFRRGQGEIVVLADSRLLCNYVLARNDHSVLAARVLSPKGEAIVFDEFYHGLSVRGQPLYLLTLPSYATVAFAIVAVMGVWTWRKACFQGPPLADNVAPRRDIREYIRAMARFLGNAKGSEVKLLSEVRAGVLRQLSLETGLPAESEDVSGIAGILERREPDRARRLLDACRQTDDLLNRNRKLSASETLDAMQRMSACL